MAKVVIAGRADCPYFARVELIGDRLSKNLPDFKLHKIIKTDDEWEKWLDETCNVRGWSHRKSPLIWRELIDRGGKGVLIGGANEFQEYVTGYYGVQSAMTSDDMTKVAEENKVTKTEVDEEIETHLALSQPLAVCITNASSPVCYNLINVIASGEVFGESTELAIRLCDSEEKREYLSGVEMEAYDLAHGLLRDVKIVCDVREAFTDCSIILLLDELEMQEEEPREEWLKRNAEYFTNYASVINEVAAKNAKVLLAGNGPLNFNACMMLKNAPNIPRQNIVAHSRMVENYAKSVVGDRLSVNPSGVVDLIVWGNINSKHYIDVTKARVHGYDGAIWGPPSYSVSAQEMIHNDKWIEKEYVELVEARRSTVEAALGHPASMAHASAVATTLKHWTNGTPKGQMFSLGVCSEGWYGVPEGLVFSYPVTMQPKGYFTVVQDIDLSEDSKKKLEDVVQELTQELEVMFPPPCPTPPVEEAGQTEDPGQVKTEDPGQVKPEDPGQVQPEGEDDSKQDGQTEEKTEDPVQEETVEGGAEKTQEGEDVKQETQPTEGEATS
ncbi:putative malate dehydrogenase 1B isoform X2 [Haliotis rufescens]|uniref:putative malate dehydrogenase 1B isoform X2 n=1 Tax=Haliotis rufescens TaxID=6454 RepID=UPI00201EDA14|nr:putative malate dehydrogenase 1B isoform X2 [Haliotis rufescens]